jgi:AraC family transcriptional regulator, regulatory protein of adaptative response / methylated-DNA-[protein]-cysteine methyltransferase
MTGQPILESSREAWRKTGAPLYWTAITLAELPALALWNSQALVYLGFITDEHPRDAQLAQWRQRQPWPISHNPQSPDPKLPWLLIGSDFQRKVWRQLQQIPRGHTCSYRDLAHAIEHPTAVRAIGQAVGANPLSVVIPCHRVLGSRGPGGYHWGLAIKHRLLAQEGVSL